MFRRCLILTLMIALPSQATVIWLEIGSAGTPAQNADGGALSQNDIDGLVFAVKDSGGAVISSASAAGLDEAGNGHFVGVIHLGDIPETAVTVQLRRLGDKQFASAGSGTALLDDFEPQVDPATYKITATTLTWVLTNAGPIATDASFTTHEDSPLSNTVAGTDADSDPLTFALVSGPVTLDPDGNFTYLPAANFAGTESFTFTVNDGFADSATGVATLVVAPANDPPVADSASVTATEDTPLTGTLSGSDIDGSFSFSQVSGNVSIASNGSFTYTPAADFAGNDSFVFRVSDGSLTDTATVAVTVTPVNDPPIATHASFSIDEDLPLHDAVTDIDSPTLFFSALSPNVSIASDGSFTYTPLAEFAGADSFDFQVSDGSLTSVATVSISVTQVNDTPIANAASFTTIEDSPLTGSVSATDIENDPISYTAVSGSVTIASDGSFTYTPAPNASAPDAFIFRASDGNGSSSATIRITINPVNDAPVALPKSINIVEDTPYTNNVIATDIDSPSLSYSAVSGSVSILSTGAFTYTPATDSTAPDSFVFRASDGALSSSATVSVSILPVNDAPVALAGAFTTAEDSTLFDSVTATDPDSPSLSYFLLSGPVALTVDGAFTYAPPADFAGSSSFTFRVADGALASTATVSLTVTPVNDPPIAIDDSFSVVEGESLTGNILDNDQDPDLGDILSAVLVGGVDTGSLTLSSDGAFTYFPAANFFGSDRFSYRASDSLANSAIAEVIIRVTEFNDTPVALPDFYVTNEDTPLAISAAAGVLANDNDVETPVLIMQLISNVTRGSLSFEADGAFTYVPHANISGTDAFSYRASDGALASTITTAHISINPINDVPTADAASFTIAEDSPLTAVVTGNDTEGASLSFSLVSGDVTLAADGSFTYTPPANFAGATSFSFRVSDGAANSAPATVSLSVTPVNDAPVADPASFTIAEDSSLIDRVTGSDTEGSPLSFSLLSGPVALTSDGSFTYAPAANVFGADSFSFRVSDGQASASATVSLTVTPKNDAPVAIPASFTTLEDSPLIGSVSGTDIDLDPLSYSLVSGAVTLSTDGSFTYTPAADFAGAASFSFRASDGITNSAPATVSIQVISVNDPPMAQPNAFVLVEDTPLLAQVFASDTEDDALSFSLLSGPVDLAADGSFTYAPPANFHGTDSFTFRVSDGPASDSASDSDTVSLSVTPVNDAVSVLPDSFTVAEDASISANVSANDSDVDGDLFRIILVADSAHGGLDLLSTGAFTYTPIPDFAGTDSFSYKANDGEIDSPSVLVSLSISAVNDPPEAAPGNFFVNEDSPLLDSLAASDTENDPLSFSLLSGNASIDADGSFTYLPAANFAGSDSFTFRVSDASGSDVATAVIHTAPINDAPVGAADNFTVNEDGSLIADVIANDSDPDQDSLTAILLATVTSGQLTLAASGAFTYLPKLDFTGTDGFTYKANDGAAESPSVSVTLRVLGANDPPAPEPDAYATAEDNAIIVPAPGLLSNDSDPDGNPLTVILISGSVTLASDGAFTYQPPANFHGIDSFVYAASDGLLSSTATVTLTIASVNDVPFGRPESFSTQEDTALSGNVIANDIDLDGDTLIAQLTSGPANGSLELATDGNFSCIPRLDFFGPDSFRYRANDGSTVSSNVLVSITVLGDNDPPVALADAYATSEDTPLIVSESAGLLSNDSDPDGDSLTASLVSGSATVASDGSFTYIPAPNATAPASFTYALSDGQASVTGTVSIAITPVNDAPVADAASFTATEDIPLTGSVTGSDIESDPLSFSLVSGPVSLASNGNFTYIPPANFNGNSSFVFRVNDGVGDSASAQVDISITPENDPPVALPDSYNTSEDTPIIIAACVVARASGSDPDADPLTVTLVAGPSLGQLELGEDGGFSYTPSANANGNDSFTYQVSDGQLSVSSTVSISIAAVNDPPVAVAVSFTGLEDAVLTASLGGSDIESNPLSFSFVSGSVITLLSNGNFSYSPPANFNGSASFDFLVNDGFADSAPATISLNILPQNDPPTANPDSFTVLEDSIGNLLDPIANDTDIDNDSLSLVGGPFSYTPAANFHGSASFSYTATASSTPTAASTSLSRP